MYDVEKDKSYDVMGLSHDIMGYATKSSKKNIDHSQATLVTLFEFNLVMKLENLRLRRTNMSKAPKYRMVLLWVISHMNNVFSYVNKALTHKRKRKKSTLFFLAHKRYLPL